MTKWKRPTIWWWQVKTGSKPLNHTIKISKKTFDYRLWQSYEAYNLRGLRDFESYPSAAYLDMYRLYVFLTS